MIAGECAEEEDERMMSLTTPFLFFHPEKVAGGWRTFSTIPRLAQNRVRRELSPVPAALSAVWALSLEAQDDRAEWREEGGGEGERVRIVFERKSGDCV